MSENLVIPTDPIEVLADEYVEKTYKNIDPELSRMDRAVSKMDFTNGYDKAVQVINDRIARALEVLTREGIWLQREATAIRILRGEDE